MLSRNAAIGNFKSLCDAHVDKTDFFGYDAERFASTARRQAMFATGSYILMCCTHIFELPDTVIRFLDRRTTDFPPPPDSLYRTVISNTRHVFGGGPSNPASVMRTEIATAPFIVAMYDAWIEVEG